MDYCVNCLQVADDPGALTLENLTHHGSLIFSHAGFY